MKRLLLAIVFLWPCVAFGQQNYAGGGFPIPEDFDGGSLGGPICTSIYQYASGGCTTIYTDSSSGQWRVHVAGGLGVVVDSNSDLLAYGDVRLQGNVLYFDSNTDYLVAPGAGELKLFLAGTERIHFTGTSMGMSIPIYMDANGLYLDASDDYLVSGGSDDARLYLAGTERIHFTGTSMGMSIPIYMDANGLYLDASDDYLVSGGNDDAKLFLGGAQKAHFTGSSLGLDVDICMGGHDIRYDEACSEVYTDASTDGSYRIYTSNGLAMVVDGSSNLIAYGNLTLDGGGTIATTSNGDITLAPNGAGYVVLNTTMSQATGDETSMRINSTWNKATSGNMTALEINIIDTLSPGAGYFVRGMKAGVAQWYINESYKLYLPGAIDFSGPLTSFGALSIATLSNGNITLDPHGTGVIKADALITSNTAGPLNLGTAAVAGYATGTGDVLVGGKWEVDGILYADGGIQLANSQAIYNSSSGSLFAVLTTQTIDPFALMLRDNARYLLIGSYAHRNIDYGFPNPDNPTIVLPSADGGTPLSRIYMYHDGTSLDAGAGTIKTDAGDIHLDPASGLVTVDGAVKASYQSSDGTAGLDSSTDYWLCTASDCSTTCQLTIKDGLITGCP